MSEPLGGPVPVRFPAETIAAVEQRAAAESMTVSAWIRREVQREIDRRTGHCHACGQEIPAGGET